MSDIIMKIKRRDYLALIARCETLEKESAGLKKELTALKKNADKTAKKGAMTNGDK